ncbi:PREDICTED: cell division cycle-associated protein 2 [Condylura cristata]|uniref:cell division cycle-associated protein 2 n=1 Tax=Condylura cristata TaxID=143302 RepID=UPI0003344BE6|nr:PREDICTED: cell division cycle-associated protein 2 [Condylura cristata]
MLSLSEKASFILESKFVTPQKQAAEVTPYLCTPDTFKSPMNFSTVTVEQLGITPESFVKNSSGKSSSYLKKSRRRSTVGARGSPETNHLIRFIAQQRNLKNAAKSPLVHSSPFQSSPGLYRNVNSLRERISAFQSAFHSVKENEKMTEISEAEGEFETTDQTKKRSVGECQQCEFPAKLSSKRRRLSSQSNSEESLTDVLDLQTFSAVTSADTDRACAAETSLAEFSEKSSESCLTQSGYLVEEPVPFLNLREASSGVKVVTCAEDREASAAVSLGRVSEVSTDTGPGVKSAVAPLCKRDIPSSEPFVLRSVLKKPSVRPFQESLQEHCDNLCEGGTHPNLTATLVNCCKEQKADGQENYKVPAFLNMRKRKRVTFGEDLSPEVFDESLPANTPLRKGGTPVCQKDLSGLRPLLLDQSPVPEQLLQPNFDDKGENLENIEPLQVSFAVLSPLSQSSISETLSGTDTFSSSNNQEKMSTCKVGTVTRTSKRRSQLISFTEETVCNLLNTEAQPCKEKKTRRRKSQENQGKARAPPRRSQALKGCRKKKGKGKKTVQKSLYGERDIASKKPLLSPIPELPESSEMTPSAPSTRRLGSDDFNSDGELEEAQVLKRKNHLPQNSSDAQFKVFNPHEVSEFCSSNMQSYLPLVSDTLDQDANINTIEVNGNKNIPNAEIKLESENELQPGAEHGNSQISCTVMDQHIMSDYSKTGFTEQSQEFVAGQNVGNPFQSFKISEDKNIKCEKQDDLLASEGELHPQHLMLDSLKEFDCPDGVSIDSIKESQSGREELGRNNPKSSSSVSGRERKQRRRSVCYSHGQSLYWEKNENHQPCVNGAIEAGLENDEVYKELSDCIEQTFQRTNRGTQVRRSTRLQKDSENEGLVWVSLPLPAASCTSQKTKRRTICTFDSRGLENLSSRKETPSSRQKPWMPPSDLGKENSAGVTAILSDVPGKRRKSFCTSTLSSTKNTTQAKSYKQRTSLSQKRENSLKDLSEV